MKLTDSLMIFAYIMFVGLVGYYAGVEDGEKRALEVAYNTNPVSEKLELVCAGLWVGQQNRKYVEMSK